MQTPLTPASSELYTHQFRLWSLAYLSVV